MKLILLVILCVVFTLSGSLGAQTWQENLEKGAAAAKNADTLFVEGITRKNVRYATWGGDTEEEKVEVIGAYHMFPARLKKVYDESGVKNIVMVHVQNYNSPENFDRLGVLNEMIDEGISNILLAQDGDLF